MLNKQHGVTRCGHALALAGKVGPTEQCTTKHDQLSMDQQHVGSLMGGWTSGPRISEILMFKQMAQQCAHDNENFNFEKL